MGEKKRKKKVPKSVQRYKKYEQSKDHDALTRYSPAIVKMCYRLALLGLTEEQISVALNVRPRTIDEWKNEYEEFAQALLDGKVIADSRVAEGLYKRACGYSHPDVHILSNRVKKYDEFGKVTEEYTEALMVPIVKHYPPDTTAAKAWLGARQKALWGESTDVNINGEMNINHTHMMEDLDDEELKMIEQIGMKKLQERTQDTN